jgi:L-methionine (R)-S-oxide reductase
MLEPGAQPPMLVLDTFRGSHDSAHANPAQSGNLRSSGLQRKTVVVDDVSKDIRYLACSLETKSEIVVPVFVAGEVAGELDIDSHFSAAFGAEDQALVQYCAQVVGKKLEKSQ